MVSNRQEKKNRVVVYATGGASNNSELERERDDYYATHPETVEALLEQLKKDDVKLNNNIWEPACGEGHISKVLENHGYNVFSTDLVDRGYGIGGVDFLQYGGIFDDDVVPFDRFDIITNPPYKLSLEFVQKSLSVLKDGDKCLMFMRIQFLEGKQRYGFFQDNPPKYVYVHSTRQNCAKNGKFERSDGKDNVSVMCFCWYLWEKGHHGETILRWIP